MRLFIAINIFFLSLNSYAKTLDPLTLNNAPIDEFTSWVSSSTGKNIFLSSDVVKPISVSVPSLDDSDIISFFENVMEASGYFVDRRDGSYYVGIKNPEQIKEDPVFKTYLYSLKNISNFHLSTYLKALAFSDKASFVPASGNTLIILCPPDLKQDIFSLIENLDVRKRQILVESIILESDYSDSNKSGFNLNSLTKNLNLSLQPSTITQNFAIFQNGLDLQAVITSLEKNEYSKILSKPTVLILDGEQGYVSVGQNVPFLTSREQNNIGTVQMIERRDVGITLSVHPTIISSDNIILDVVQQSSSLATSTIATDVITNKRELKSSISLADGQSVVLGGLVVERSSNSDTTVPLLKRLPLINRLFKGKTKDSSTAELNILLKVTLI